MPKNITLTILTLTAALLIFGCKAKNSNAAPSAPNNVESPIETPTQTPGKIELNQPYEPNISKPQETNEPNLVSKAEPPVVSNVEPNTADTVVPQLQPVPTDLFNMKFAPIFETYVDSEGMVNYNSLRRKKPEIDNIFSQLASLQPEIYQKWPDSEKIAFWINAYNLKMLDIIIANYPIESSRIHRLLWPTTSIRHIQPRNEVGSPKWNGYKFIVMDEEFTLSEIENRFFRQKFSEPRVFLALSFASKDSPPLRNEPYLGQKLNEQLDDQAKKFFNSPSGLQTDIAIGKVFISAVFDELMPWYGNEFLKYFATDKKFKSHPPSKRAVLNFATNYLPANIVDYLETGNYTIQFKTYDWRLNEQ